MSKSKYTVIAGLASVKTTGEPVFVKGFELRSNLFGDGQERVAIVIRPVVTQNGIDYRKEEIPVEELETRHEQVKRNIEFEQFVQTLRQESEAKRYALPTELREALEKNGQPPALNPSTKVNTKIEVA
jgi:hypothetical protein